MSDILSQFSWHSSFGMDEENFNGKKIVSKLEYSKGIREKFISASDKSDFLIHKATKALWRFSDDGSYIVPVFEEDILTEEEL